MKRCTALALFLFSLASLAGQEPCPEPGGSSAGDLKKLQGTWKMVKATRGGENMKKDLKGVEVKFEKDQMSILEGSKREEKVKITLDAKKNPRQIDLSHPSGDKEKIFGIYKIDKGQVTICFSRPGKTRPSTFADAEATVFVLEKGK